MSSINVDEDDLEAERPILKNMALNKWDASARLDNQEIKSVFRIVLTAARSIRVTLKAFQNLSSKDCAHFIMAGADLIYSVIVTGDIDR